MEFDVKGCGPNKGSLKLDFRAGGNVLLACNGGGKSLALEGVRAAAGDLTARLVRNRDSETATVIGPGVVLKMGAKQTKTGAPAVELASVSRIHELLDPKGKTSKTRARQRVDALLSFSQTAVDQDVLLSLCSGNEMVAAGVQQRGQTLNLEQAGDKAKSFAEAMARTHEDEIKGQGALERSACDLVDELLGEIADSEERPGGTAEEASEEYQEGLTVLGGLGWRRKVREGKEEEREKARDLLQGKRPDDVMALENFRLAQSEVERLRRDLAVTESLFDKLEDISLETTKAAKVWDAAQAQINEKIDGPEAEEVEAKERDVQALVEKVEALELWEKLDKAEAESVQAKTKILEEQAKADGLRSIAKNVSKQVNSLLKAENFGGLYIDEGDVCYAGKETKGEMISLEELSEGQRSRAVLLGVGLLRFDQEDDSEELAGMLPVDRAWWFSLAPARMRELVKLSLENRICIATEMPTDGASVVMGYLDYEWIDSGLRAEMWLDRSGE